MSSTLIKFLDGTAELSIVETSSFRTGGRKWVVSDVDNVRKGFVLKSGGRMLGANHWIYYDDFIEDGKLVTAKKVFVKARRKVALDPLDPLAFCYGLSGLFRHRQARQS